MSDIDNIPIFVINLPERNDRWCDVMLELSTSDITFTGWAATKNENGRFGLILTMIEVFEYCLDKGYDKVLVFEDDINILVTKFKDRMAKCIEQLPVDFDLFYPGCNLSGKCNRYSQNLLSAQGMYSSHAILYSRKAIKKILPLLPSRQAYDVVLANNIQKEGNCYVSYPLLVSQKESYSDIEGRIVNYQKFIEKRYAEKTKHL